MPFSRISPPVTDSPRRVCPSSARATVVFPDPDSPTRPSTSPGRTVNEIPLTTGGPRRSLLISRSRTCSRCLLCASGGCAAFLSLFFVVQSAAPIGAAIALPVTRSSSRAASAGLRPTPIAAWPIASVSRLVPMVSSAIMAAGTITAHGFSGRPVRFSLIIIPQLAAGGCWPNPRKASPDMMMIE